MFGIVNNLRDHLVDEKEGCPDFQTKVQTSPNTGRKTQSSHLSFSLSPHCVLSRIHNFHILDYTFFISVSMVFVICLEGHQVYRQLFFKLMVTSVCVTGHWVLSTPGAASRNFSTCKTRGRGWDGGQWMMVVDGR